MSFGFDPSRNPGQAEWRKRAEEVVFPDEHHRTVPEVRADQLRISHVGEPGFHSPLTTVGYVDDEDQILWDRSRSWWKQHKSAIAEPPFLELGGPRRRILLDPKETRVAIVSCGGLCPGINDVIRAIVMQLWFPYGVREIVGLKYGFRSLAFTGSENLRMRLAPEMVAGLHLEGGSFLGSSRGSPPVSEMVDSLQDLRIDCLFVIGGDGSLRAAHAIHEEAAGRSYPMALVAAPKTVDNDIAFVPRSFGYETAFSVAAEAIRCANREAEGAPGGIGLVKVMGREAGFIAAAAALSLPEVNFVLVPEVRFDIHGQCGLLAALERRIQRRGHAVVVVAEGAGQDHMPSASDKDDSGNPRLGDIGIMLASEINRYFGKRDIEINLKYIDPSYMVRSVPATASDSLYCLRLGQNAVHAALAGKTDLVVAQWGEEFVHLPLTLVAGRRKSFPMNLWESVIQATGQPREMTCQ